MIGVLGLRLVEALVAFRLHLRVTMNVVHVTVNGVLVRRNDSW